MSNKKLEQREQIEERRIVKSLEKKDKDYKNENAKNQVSRRNKQLNLRERLKIKIPLKKNYIILIQLIYLFSIVLSNNISLAIKGKGYKNILTSNEKFTMDNYPVVVYINEEQKDTVENIYYFNEEENYVILIWNKTIKILENMFLGCEAITEVNLFYFDSSQIETIFGMFNGCSSLISVNFSNFDTTNVWCMSYLFSNCSSLISLDLSKFNTHLVQWMDNMFSGCVSLISLNLSNFKTSSVKGFNHMFYKCTSLTSLDLSNFYTDSIKELHFMFYGCSNLQYTNIKHFDGNDLYSESYSSEQIFKGVSDNIVVCIDDNLNSQVSNSIKTQLNDIKCHTIDCSENWLLKQKK